MFVTQIDQCPFGCVGGQIAIDVFESDDDVETLIARYQRGGYDPEGFELVSPDVELEDFLLFIIALAFWIDVEIKGPSPLDKSLGCTPFFGVFVRGSYPNRKVFPRLQF